MSSISDMLFKKSIGLAITGIIIAASSGLICNRRSNHEIPIVITDESLTPEERKEMEKKAREMLEKVKEQAGKNHGFR